VNFIGCCYGTELTCLILEFVNKGTLSDMLIGESAFELDWVDPLFRLACDVARGMAYLHNATDIKDTILHRDLKPENVLITEFLLAKITDFGTSRIKEINDDVTMSSVGTPLFCAPEIVRGEKYDEKVDVYSFGLVLLDMATEESLIDFIGERWRIYNNKKVKPKQPMRFIRSMTEDGWRPVTIHDIKGNDDEEEDDETSSSSYSNSSKKQQEGPHRFLRDQSSVLTTQDDVSLIEILPLAPKTIMHLIIKCFDHNPESRPSFIDILNELEYNCSNEINTPQFAHKALERKRSRRSKSGGSNDDEGSLITAEVLNTAASSLSGFLELDEMDEVDDVVAEKGTDDWFSEVFH